MKKLGKLSLWLTACLLTLAPTLVQAANVVIVADTRKLDGLRLWWAQIFNDSHLSFMILTIVIVPLSGCILGLMADFVMNHIGIDLKNRSAAE